MFEWLQTLILSLGGIAVGGVITLGAGYLQHRLTKAVTLEVEEREAQHRLRQEERNARRAYRREQIAPISEALNVVIGRRAHEDTENLLKGAYDRRHEPNQTFEQYLNEHGSSSSEGYEMGDVVRTLLIARSTATTLELSALITKVMDNLTTGEDKLSPALIAVHLEIERFVSEVE